MISPFGPRTATDDFPPLPIIICSRSRQLADGFFELQGVIESLGHIDQPNDLLYELYHLDEVRAAFPNQEKFYVVVYGRVPAGIYTDQFVL